MVYPGRMPHKPLDFSPAAADEWDLIVDRDRPLAEAIDPLFDAIEAGELVGQMFDNHARFHTLRVRGRDELYAIVWEGRGDKYVLRRVGRVDVPHS